MSNSDAARELLKAEYERIKSEQVQRIGFRDNMLFVHLAAVGAIASWVLTNMKTTSLGYQSLDAPSALLVIPWVGIVLGWTYVVNDHLISRTGRYVRDVLSPRAANLASLQTIEVEEDGLEIFEIVEFFGWEPFHRLDKRRISRKYTQCAIDLATFVVPGFGAICAFIVVSDWKLLRWWRLESWTWRDVGIGGIMLIEIIGLIIILYSIIAYADFKRENVAKKAPSGLTEVSLARAAQPPAQKGES